MHEKLPQIENIPDIVNDDAYRLLAPPSSPEVPLISAELLTPLTSSDPEERLEAVEHLVSLRSSGSHEVTRLLRGCQWDPDERVRAVAESALMSAENEGTLPGREKLIEGLRSDLSRLTTTGHALRRGELLQELAKDAAFLPELYAEAVSGVETTLVDTFLRLERDMRVLYSAMDLDYNFPEAWLEHNQEAIRSLITLIPGADNALLEVTGSELGGVFAAQTLASVYKKLVSLGQPVDFDPLCNLLYNDDPRIQFQALTTIEHLETIKDALPPEVIHLLQPITEEYEDDFEELEDEEYGFEGEECIAPKESLEGLTKEELERREAVRELIRSITEDVFFEVGITETEDFEVRFIPVAEMEESLGLALPSVLIISDEFLPALDKVFRNQPLDYDECLLAVSALSTVLHEGRHLAQFRLVPEKASAACAQEILKPQLRLLSKAARSEVFDGARASVLDYVEGFDLDGRVEVQEDAGEERELLSLERLRAEYVAEVDASCYEMIHVWHYIDQFPTLKDAFLKYRGADPFDGAEAPADDSSPAKDRRDTLRALLRMREGDDVPFSYFRKL